MHLRARRAREHRAQQADRAGAQDEDPIARPELGALDGPQRVAGGLDERAESSIHVVGQPVQRGRGHRDLLGQGARPAAPDADLLPEFAHVLVAAPAATTPPAPEHRVAGHAAADPGGIHSRAHARDRAHPLMADPHREVRVPLMQVRHLAGVELHVGAADPRPLDVDDDVARLGHRRVDLLHARFAGRGDHEGAHVSAARARSGAESRGHRFPTA